MKKNFLFEKFSVEVNNRLKMLTGKNAKKFLYDAEEIKSKKDWIKSKPSKIDQNGHEEIMQSDSSILFFILLSLPNVNHKPILQPRRHTMPNFRLISFIQKQINPQNSINS